jgi:hypothetical protein
VWRGYGQEGGGKGAHRGAEQRCVAGVQTHAHTSVIGGCRQGVARNRGH